MPLDEGGNVAVPARPGFARSEPLDFLVDPGNLQRGSREWQGTTRFFFALPYENRYIWGATAGMLVNLAEVLAPELAGGRPETDF